ncbi:unnamed protein product, partial [Meganyctiphanes norvegica]
MVRCRRICQWSWVLLCCLLTLAVCDEEDPHQHVAQIAARGRQLTRILQLIGSEQPSKQQLTNPQAAAAPTVESTEPLTEKTSAITSSDDSGSSVDTAGNSVPPTACVHKELDVKIPKEHLWRFSSSQTAALHVANLLNNLYFAAIPERGIDDDDFSVSGRLPPVYPQHVFSALVSGTLEAEPQLVSCGIAFLRGAYHAPEEGEKDGVRREMFAAYSYRGQDGRIHSTDLVKLYNSSYDDSTTKGTAWFTSVNSR